MSENKNHDEVADTGHEWDGIRELKNPPPRWWLIAFYLSGLFVLVYFILYPSLPLPDGHTKGLLGWTQIKEYKEGVSEIEKKRAKYEKKIAEMPVQKILADPEMRNYAVNASKVLFGDNCAACHGIGGEPAKGSGYPILADDNWIYGGDIKTIMTSIASGRHAMMPAHAKMLKPEEVDRLVKFVEDASKGTVTKAQWQFYRSKDCVACHGQNAKGNQEMGAANFTDKIWRFSGDPKQVRYTILHGVNDPSDPKTRIAVMPSWNEKLAVKLEAEKWGDTPEYDGTETQRLSESDIKKLAVYVHELGGGK